MLSYILLVSTVVNGPGFKFSLQQARRQTKDLTYICLNKRMIECNWLAAFVS